MSKAIEYLTAQRGRTAAWIETCETDAARFEAQALAEREKATELRAVLVEFEAAIARLGEQVEA